MRERRKKVDLSDLEIVFYSVEDFSVLESFLRAREGVATGVGLVLSLR